ncbi:MAG: 3-dehydroquinate synthase [Streptococcaceae bacterium]|jgi:3-dehydroquinate synthase|nr:3-dehydroquinate synthase [Streptococcaceae bacterium]MCH4176798.1 3-dehydroquinate synthase [Streptococcaceae bacterium]
MKLNVNLPSHPYDLWIEKGAIKKTGEWAKALWQPQTIAIITDNHVASLYLLDIQKQLEAVGFKVIAYVFPEGEASKSLKTAEEAYLFLAENGMTRSDGIIALGGGVVGDLAGFVASTFMRGIHFLQIPTTLVAQVDSSIGGKTGVNTAIAKNMVGTFAQPDGVLIDPDVLATLDERRVREGIGEIVKCAAIDDIELWHELESYQDEFDLVNHAETVIHACCDVKRRVVVEDELDNGIRLILNFGHTIGHAIEATAGYGVVTHGEGVAIGMVQMNRIAEAKGLSPKGSTAQLITMLEKFHLPIRLSPWNEEQLYEALTHDKKARGSKIKTIILEAIGKAKINPIDLVEMKDYLKVN